MRASKFSIEKLLKAIAIIKTGITIKDACRQENIILTTFYSWRRTLEMAILLQKNSLFKQLSSQTTLKAKREATKLKEKRRICIVKADPFRMRKRHYLIFWQK
jgi:transposase-like protein